jgi:hypothetical protein
MKIIRPQRVSKSLRCKTIHCPTWAIWMESGLSLFVLAKDFLLPERGLQEMDLPEDVAVAVVAAATAVAVNSVALCKTLG